MISSLSSTLKSTLLHSPPADTTVVATLLSAATSVNPVKRFRRFVRHVAYGIRLRSTSTPDGPRRRR